MHKLQPKHDVNRRVGWVLIRTHMAVLLDDLRFVTVNNFSISTNEIHTVFETHHHAHFAR